MHPTACGAARRPGSRFIVVLGTIHATRTAITRQKHCPASRARHARAQPTCLTQARPAAPSETSRSRLPARTAAHHQLRDGRSVSACRRKLAVLPLHEEARAVHRDHVEVKLAVLSKVTVHSVGRRHEPPTIVSRNCAKQNKAAGGHGSARKRRGTGRQGVWSIGIAAGLIWPRQARWRGHRTDRQAAAPQPATQCPTAAKSLQWGGGVATAVSQRHRLQLTPFFTVQRRVGQFRLVHTERGLMHILTARVILEEEGPRPHRSPAAPGARVP